MAAKKKIALFCEVNDEKDFYKLLNIHSKELICAEIYCGFAGPCFALEKLLSQMKLAWSNGSIILLKVLADAIEALDRFKGHSEPVFMFIYNQKVTKVFRGIDTVKFTEVAKLEIQYHKLDKERPVYEIDEPTPDEIEWLTRLSNEKKEQKVLHERVRELRQQDRKRHRAEVMVPYLESLNFVLYWPHCTHAHPELYERWDANNIIMIGREEMQLTEDVARDILYAGDAPINEASMHKLLSGPALAICFRLLDSTTNFTELIRKILYEDLPAYDDRKSADEQFPRVTAYDYYKTISPTKEDVLRQRQEEKERRKEEKRLADERRLLELQRLAREAIEEALEKKRNEKEQRKLDMLKVGNLTGLKSLEEEEDEEIDIDIPEELPPELIHEELSDEENENEYFPPPGLVIPGLYAPNNDIAKVNGLALLFPKIVSDYMTVPKEFLPPHVLVLLDISKRYKAIEAMADYKEHIIHMGIFKVNSIQDCVHIAYSVKQYDTLDISTNENEMNMSKDNIKLAIMVSVKTDVPLLQLMDLYPVHVSRNPRAGEDECAVFFSVQYADDYDEFEDFHTQNDEETLDDE